MAEPTLDSEGFAVAQLATPASELAEIAGWFEHLWRARPETVTYRGACGGEAPMSEMLELLHRAPGARLVGVHRLDGPVARLADDESLLDALGGPVTIRHSEAVEWGGGTALTRDSWFVDDTRARVVLVPVEDVSDKAGTWLVHPGSHRLPGARLPQHDPERRHDVVEAARHELRGMLEQSGLAPEAPARTVGEALVLAPEVARADAPIVNVDYTRRSLLLVVTASSS
jgi:hypothetical protein